MSVIIRLQNLPWSANALDIRQYFRGLSIPEGGVHIVGGELGDAFIAFSTDEDARQAFQLNNGKIKEVQIKLLLSSRTEMQKVIEAARTASTTPFMQTLSPVIPAPAMIPQAPIIASMGMQPAIVPANQEPAKKDDKDSRSRDDSKGRRDRSRRRTRSRSRSRDRKDRSRDRRDSRRRRDRSRSRDRRDRRRDRRGRSRSRDRTKSRDRDSRRSKDDKKDNRGDSKSNDCPVIEIKDDINLAPIRCWDTKPPVIAENKPSPGLLGNYPGSSSFEDARRSLGLLAGLHNNQAGPNPNMNNNNNNGNNMNNRFQRNEMNNPIVGGRENWPRKSRFQDRNSGPMDNPELGLGNNQFQNNMQPRMVMNQQNMNMGNPGMDMRPNPNMFQNPGGMRMPMHQDNGFNPNRPFLSRPGTMFPEQFRPQFNVNNEDQFRNDNNVGVGNQFKAECCVQLRPYFGGYGEVRKFFHGLFINNTGLKFVTDETGKKTGIVYVRFVRPGGKEQALSRSGMMLRGIPVEVAHLDDDEFERYGDDNMGNNEESQDSRKDQDSMNSPRQQQQQQHFTCVVVDDLPEFAKEHDILKLFAEYTIISVHMVVNKQYRPLAYVQFNKEEDAMNAIGDKTAHVIGGKPVTVRPISDEAFSDIRRQQATGELIVDTNYSENDRVSPPPHDLTDTFSSNGPPHIITDCVLLTGMPHKTSDRDVIDFFSDVGLVPIRIHMLLGKFGPSGECYCEFNNPEEAICALDKNGMPLGSGTVRVELFLRREMERNLGLPLSAPPLNPGPGGPRFQGRFGPRGPNPNMMGGPRPPPNMIRRRPPGPPGPRYDGPVDPMGPPGCVVTMENVPFKSGVNEILNFFDGYDLSTHNVFRRFNDIGAPTGDARVTFNSPAEARRAVEECNKLKIRDRTVYLRLL